MKDEKRKKLKNVIKQIERDSHPERYHRAMRELRKEEYEKSGEAKFLRWKKKYLARET